MIRKLIILFCFFWGGLSAGEGRQPGGTLPPSLLPPLPLSPVPLCFARAVSSSRTRAGVGPIEQKMKESEGGGEEMPGGPGEEEELPEQSSSGGLEDHLKPSSLWQPSQHAADLVSRADFGCNRQGSQRGRHYSESSKALQQKAEKRRSLQLSAAAEQHKWKQSAAPQLPRSRGACLASGGAEGRLHNSQAGAVHCS